MIKYIIGALLSVAIGILPNLIDLEVLMTSIQKWPKLVFAFLVVLFAIALMLGQKLKEKSAIVTSLRCRIKNMEAKEAELHQKLKEYDISEEDIAPWSHSILICDDEPKYLAMISDDMLAGSDFDYVTVRDISDYRLASNFEIIICDLMNVGAGTNSAPVLNTIKEKYPYKIVIGMSISKSIHEECHLRKDIPVIQKDQKGKFKGEILEMIKESSKELDNVNAHWNRVLADLKRAGDDKNIETHKKNYYSIIANRMKK